jgi:ATP-dependent RNA helicase DOB1
MVAEYYNLSRSADIISQDMIAIAMHPNHVLPFLQPGRIIEYSTVESKLRLGLIVNNRRAHGSKGDHILDVYNDLQSSPSEDLREDIVPINLPFLRRISSVRVKLPTDLTSSSSKTKLSNTFRDVIRRLEGKIPYLDPVADFGLVSSEYDELVVKHKEVTSKLKHSSLHDDSNREALLQLYERKFQLLEESKQLKITAKESQAVVMKDTMRKMKRVLKKLQYISENGVLGPKGRFACELTTADELVLTDMIFDGAFNSLSVEETVAVLSCFVHKEGQSNEKNDLRPEFAAAIRLLQNTARNVCRVSNDARIVMDEEEYVKSFDTALLEAAHAWASGSRFAEVCKLTDIFEGSIIRSLRRLEELLRQLTSASTAIGNMTLREKFEAGAEKIRRGVVFAASLYI